MNPRTKISLIIVMLIAAAGLFYAATPTFFTFAPSPTGIAATPGKMYVSEYCDPQIDTITDTGIVTPFATMTGCGYDHSGITFDHEGTFGFDMIVTCGSGDIWRVDSTGTTPVLIKNLGLGDAEYEGPAVVPQSFGPLGGQILVADEDHSAVHAIDNLGNVTLNVFSSFFGAEGVLVIPGTPCSFGNSNAVLVSALQQ